MNKRRINLAVLLPLLLLATVVLTSCLEPRIGFQGRLTDTSGNPVPDGDYDVEVRFWTQENGGTSVFTDTQTMKVQDGLFNTDIQDFPPHIFSKEVLAAEDTLYMEITVDGETLTPRQPVPGAPYAHALVAGSGVVGARQDSDHVTDGGFDAALTVINNDQTDYPGYGIRAQSGNGAVYADNVHGNGSLAESVNPEDNPDIILGGYYLSDLDGTTEPDNDDGPGVIASDPSINFSDIHVRSNDELYLYKSYYGGSVSEFRIYDGPNDSSNIQARLDRFGNWSVEGSLNSGGADYAERIDVEGPEANYEPGDVLVISDEVDRAVELSDAPNSSRVLGVYSANPGFVGGAGTPGEQVERQRTALQEAGVDPDDEGTLTAANLMEVETQDGAIEVAIAGIVSVKVTDENGPIQRGDLLTTSSTPGHAMKALDPEIGTVLGKAMGTLDSGTGVIEVLIMLQ